jgi:hypothetical protein
VPAIINASDVERTSTFYKPEEYATGISGI